VTIGDAGNGWFSRADHFIPVHSNAPSIAATASIARDGDHSPPSACRFRSAAPLTTQLLLPISARRSAISCWVGADAKLLRRRYRSCLAVFRRQIAGWNFSGARHTSYNSRMFFDNSEVYRRIDGQVRVGRLVAGKRT
jgi:hypothetical protein